MSLHTSQLSVKEKVGRYVYPKATRAFLAAVGISSSAYARRSCGLTLVRMLEEVYLESITTFYNALSLLALGEVELSFE